MVTRKPVGSAGPPLDTSGASNNTSAAPPYPTTPTTTTALDRSKTIHSIDSCYSPDLHQSPAFDLIDMDEARQRPRRDSDVSSHGTWDSDEDNEQRHTPEEAEIPQPLRIRPSQQDIQQDAEEDKDELPAVLRPGPAEGAPLQPRRSQEIQRYASDAQANPWAGPSEQQQQQHQHVSGPGSSSNPYRQQNIQATESGRASWYSASPAQPTDAPPAPPVELPTVHTPADELSQLSLGEAKAEGKPFETAEVLPVPQQGRPPYPSVMDLNPAEARDFSSNNPWRQPSSEDVVSPPTGPPPAPSQREQPQYAPPPGPPPKGAPTASLVDHEENPSHTEVLTQSHPQPPAPISTAQPPASRSTETVPETPGTIAKRQRSEHYQIKHVNWQDASNPSGSPTMRRSPILTQNANGPCPLLALVNALVLSTPDNLNTALVETLRTREQVSLGLLLDAVFDELMSGRRGDTAQELPDVGELYAFLLALHTGMNVNPRFITPAAAPGGSLDSLPPDKTAVHPIERAQTKAGCCEETKEMRLYSTFNIPLIHGWTAPKDTPAYLAFERSAQTFEDAQNIQFLESDLEEKLRSQGLSGQEQQTSQDIQTIKTFLNTWPTQLTDYGLETINASLKPGQIAILFRNDHFSTLYKEPRYGALMTLVTDTGYSSHDEIVWESLVDVNGSASEMFSGDFRTVSHGQDVTGNLNQGSSAGGEDGWQTVERRNRNQQGQPRPVNSAGEVAPPLPGPRPASRQSATLPTSEVDTLGVGTDVQRTASEQEDHDLALALQLQEEEENQQRQADQRRRREQELSERYLSSTSPEGPRPAIPPRRSGGAGNRTSQAPPSGRPPVTRRADNAGAEGAEAPPTYEQSASDRPYRPAGSTASGGLQQGNPLNAYDALRRQQQGSSLPGEGLPPGHNRRQSQGNRIRRRSSQVPEVAGHIPSDIYGQVGNGRSGAVSGAAGVRDADRCTIM